MKTISQQLSFYAAYHRNPWNVATHFVGIPAIIIALLIPLGWLRVADMPVPLTGALIFTVVVWAYYMLLDVQLALCMLLFIAPAVYMADMLSRLSWSYGLLFFFGLFVGGWIFQFIGHLVFEKNRPAFVDNLIQLLIGPLFLGAEALFFLGFRKRLRDEVHAATLAPRE